uniref:Small ribosomal subunit protein uS4c n=1 Tax=Stigeoclonium helveticum TaxID=55999 RepID=RR4_STIHE|nr:ribosomal protein S4 [Stigeoclonium helveticum]Q06SJ3.1 RecName: Full=Small ribosomal subunit protein uS4c; AltName: Full=30S ribosomal protein S4, chloroplastic [Stigeoclonium helveticum]ABF60198.1 ribosomal protein S4 [Stigeoclonium helveticum]
MSRYLGPRLRITRRLGHLSGLTRKKPAFKPLNPVNPFGPRKIIPPGEHGRNKSFKKKPYESCEYDYLIRLKLKQRLRFHYGLTERQLVRYVQQAKKIKGSTGRVLLRLLEMRLDNIVFRLHMAPTIKAARQLISHGHILINKKKVTIPSYQCEPKDIITVAPKIISMELVSRFLSEFDREKSRYDRILQILEFGRKGVTMPTKNLKTSSKTLSKNSQSRKYVKNEKRAKIQSLKIGAVLNVTINHRGRKEADAISYGFGKMIVIHPFFVGKQSINKNVRVIIYKKSKNNKILYTYPANPFYLHLENLRKLNSLDVAKLFSHSNNQISSKFNKKPLKKSITRKSKRSISALILMNGAKMLPKTNLERRKRVNKDSATNLTENKQIKKEFSPSVFVRIVAAKCLNSKSKQKLLNVSSFQSSLKKFNPSFSKDPVAYREKYVYTKTSRALRLFGTRFYATILKNTRDVKNSSFIERKKFDSRIIGKTPKVNLTKTTRKAEAKAPDFYSSIFKKSSDNQSQNFLNAELLKRESQNSSFSSTFNNSNKVEFSNGASLPVTFKSGKVNNTLIPKLNSNKLADQSVNAQLMNVPALFKQYKNIFSKLSSLKNQKNFKKPKYTNLRSKILTNFLFESKNLSLNLNHFHNFIFVVFSKFCKVLVSKTNLNFKIDNILSISQNFKEFFKHRNFEAKSIDSKKFSMDILLFSLKLKHFTKLNNKNVGTEIGKTREFELSSSILDKKIQNDISLLLLLDKMKTHLQTSLNFVNQFFSSEILMNGIRPYFSSIFSFVLKSEELVKTILTNVINSIKTVLTCSKLTTLKISQQSFLGSAASEKLEKTESFFLENNLIEKLVNLNSNQSNTLYKKIINFAMVSIPKAVFLVDYSENQISLLNKYSLYSAKKQKIQMVKTLNFLKRYNLINYSNFENFKQMIQLNIKNHQTILVHFKDSILNKSKLNLRRNKLSPDSELVLNLEQKLLINQTKCKISLLESLKSNSKLSLFSQFNQNCNQILCRTKIFLNILNKKNSLFQKLNLLKDFHLIKGKDYESLKNLLNNQFQLLQKLKSLVSIVDFPQSVSQSSLLNRVLNKNLEKITETFGSISTLWKVLILQKQNKLNVTESVKQNILQNISVAKAEFTQTVLITILNKTDLSAFIKHYQSSKINNFTFISKLHKINLLDKLNKLNLLDDTVFVQMFSDIREKLAVKKLKQTNVVLTKFLEFGTMSKLSQTELLSLDSFIQTAFLNSNSLTNNIQHLGHKERDNFVRSSSFWKKFSFLLTPSLIKKGLENLKTLNSISSSQYSYLILKLQNLYDQNKTLNLGLNKQYVHEKLRIIKTLLVLIAKNVNITTLTSLNLFKNTTWGSKTLLNLGLNRQKELKLMSGLLISQKIKYSSSFQKWEKDEFSFLMTNYIENQYNYLISKILMRGILTKEEAYFYSRENCQDYLTEKLSFLHSETKQILTSIKLYLLRYQFMVQNNKNSSFSPWNLRFQEENFSLKSSISERTLNSSRIFSLKKQKSVLLDKTMYQKLKNFLQKEILSKNMKSLLENKHFILAYLNKELKAKLFYKVSRLQRKNTLLTETEIYEFSNTFKKLTASNLSVKLATNLSTLIAPTNLSTNFTKKIFKIYKSTNIPVYYNLLSNDTTFLDNKIDNVYLSKVLNKLKLQLNNNKLDLLMVNYTNDKLLRLRAKSSMYQTFAKLAFIENGMILNKHLFPVRSAKSVYLKQFNKNLKFVIYLYNLNMLRSRDILSVQQYEQFKDNYENIFKLIKRKTFVISILNKRKKWKFINYGTYQTLFKNISKNLTTKILSLFQQSTEKNFFQKEKVNKQVQYSLEVEALVQQTLEQLVNSSESPNHSLTSLIYRFIEKSIVFTHPSSNSLKQLTIENKTVIKPVIKKALQRLISLQKKLKSLGPWSSKEKIMLQNKQKTLILQSLVSYLQKQETPFNSNFKTVSNKFKQISMFQTLSFAQRKTVLNKLCLNTYFTPNLQTISNAKDLSNEKKSRALALSGQLTNLQFKLQKEYLTKLNVSLLKAEKNESDLISFNESILLMLQKTTGVDLTNYKQFSRIVTNNSNIDKGSLAKEIYTTKLLFEFIRQNLMDNYRKDKFNFELKQVSKFQKSQFLTNILFKGGSFSSRLSLKKCQNNLIKLKISKLLNHIFSVMPFVNNQTTTTGFISYDHIDTLVSFGIISSTMANVLNKKINVQIQKQKLRKTLLSLQNLQKMTFTSSNKFNRLIYSSILMDVFSRLYELKKAKTITERKYVLIKQKLKIFSLFSALNYKLLDLKEKGSISSSKALELKNQIIQKISQKMKKVKTFAKFKQSLKALKGENFSSRLSYLPKDLDSQKTLEKAKAFEFNPSLLKILKSRGRWARVTVKQLVKQKLLTTKQQEKLQTIVDKQNLMKMKKLRRLVSVFVYCRQIVETQRNTVANNSNYEPLMQNVISSVLKSFNGPWKRVLLNLLYKQNFISENLFLSYLTNNTQKTKSSKTKVISLNNNVDTTYTKTKLKRLLTMYYKQICKLRQFQTNREILKGEFEQKLSAILSSVILVLEKGGLDAFKVIYNTKWVNELCQSNLKINNQKNKNSQISSAIREFVSKYNFLKDQYLNTYKKLQLNDKMKLFKMYKTNLLQELVNLEKTIKSPNAQSFEKSEILSISRLEQLKMQGLISTKICNKLTVMLNNSLQRLIKLDRLFALQNLYLVTSEAKAISENASYMNTGAVLEANSSKVQIQTESNIIQNNEQYIKLKQKIFQSYFRYEYKHIEKSVIKQKLLLQRLDSYNLKQKTTKQYKTNLRRKKSKLLSSEQFNSFFQQLLNFLDSRYKSAGRNRRNPRINSIIRRLNQKLSFDKTLTKKFGDHLQTFIDKRFGPALPIPPHLELKRWKIKTSKLQSKQKLNLKYFILPVGIVRDLAPRRSVGLPILERLIVEYYSRN